MNFTSKVTSGECQICFLELGYDSIIHQDGGELHPIHRKCLEIWMKKQETSNQVSTCPICNKNINSIESTEDALIRMAKQGDEIAIKAFMKNEFFFLSDGLAVCAASQNGHYKIVEVLLESGSISNEICGLALEQATKNGHIETVKVLLYKSKYVPADALEKCFHIAKEKGYENIVAEIEIPYEISKLFKNFQRV